MSDLSSFPDGEVLETPFVYSAHDLAGQSGGACRQAHGLIRTAPAAGAVMGIAYWQEALSDSAYTPQDILLDCGDYAAIAFDALHAGFHVSFIPDHPAFDRLHALADTLGLIFCISGEFESVEQDLFRQE